MVLMFPKRPSPGVYLTPNVERIPLSDPGSHLLSDPRAMLLVLPYVRVPGANTTRLDENPSNKFLRIIPFLYDHLPPREGKEQRPGCTDPLAIWTCDKEANF